MLLFKLKQAFSAYASLEELKNKLRVFTDKPVFKVVSKSYGNKTINYHAGYYLPDNSNKNAGIDLSAECGSDYIPLMVIGTSVTGGTNHNKCVIQRQQAIYPNDGSEYKISVHVSNIKDGSSGSVTLNALTVYVLAVRKDFAPNIYGGTVKYD